MAKTSKKPKDAKPKDATPKDTKGKDSKPKGNKPKDATAKTAKPKDAKSKKAKAGDAKGKSAKVKDTKGKSATSKDSRSKDAKAAMPKSARKGAVDAEQRPLRTSWTEALRVEPGTDLASIDPRSTPAFDGDKKDGKELLDELADPVSDLQEQLYAEASAGGNRSLLLVIQGMDTAGKGGIMRHVVGTMDPQGVALTSFKAPTEEEKQHPFLWRIRNAVPEPGEIGVFDRSHYEDVLIVRVHDLVPKVQWARRYGQITNFEKRLVEQGTTVVKVMLHISKEEQGERLAERLDRSDKHWKYNPADVDERGYWEDYQEAYQAVIDKTSTDTAPWFVVPADRKWYARLAVMNLVREHLQAMEPQWPEVDFDVEAEKQRLAES